MQQQSSALPKRPVEQEVQYTLCGPPLPGPAPKTFLQHLGRACYGPGAMPHRYILRYFNLEALDQDKAQIALIEPCGIILWVNHSWEEFAVRNGGATVIARFPVGSSYFDGIGGELKGFYQGRFTRCVDTGEPFSQDYECSSVAELRLYRMRALPIESSSALLLEHSLLASQPIQHQPSTPDEALYRHPNGLLYQCSNCRRTKTLAGEWVWIPEWVSRSPEKTSHGICKVCMGFYWGQRYRITLPKPKP